MQNGKHRALVVDDNPVNRRIAVSLLERLQFHADASTGGQEALSLISQCYYDVVLMDCQMPEMDGLTATRALREYEKLLGAHALVVGVTAHGSREDCLKAGMDDHIEKPLTMKLLQSVLLKYLPAAVSQL